MNDTLDPVTLAVLRGRLEQVADEMDATLYRSAFNPIIAEAHDACHGLYDATTGDTLVQGKSGSEGARRRLVSAMARSLPALTCGSAEGRPSTIICTCPASRSDTAGALPR